MRTGELIKYIEDWAPPESAWENDNCGVQVGSRNRKIKNIFLSLELTPKALQQAIKKKCNLILTHHPLIFKPLKKLDFTNDPKSELVEILVKNDITLYSAHTNLDFTAGGVSFQLAERLGLRNINFLEHEYSNQYKIVVYVPQESLEKVYKAAFKAGGGIIGEYSNCSQFFEITGTFQGSSLTNPAVGEKNKFEQVKEQRFELLVHKWKVDNVVSAIMKAHPYEEPAIDVICLKNKNINFGYGAIGELDSPLTEKEFLKLVSSRLKNKNLKFCRGTGKKIKKVAVCGGSGSELIAKSIAEKADAFVTADIKYHGFQDSEGKILLIDAGHYETEVVVLDEIKKRIQMFVAERDKKINVFKYIGSTNPIKFYNNL